MPITDPRTLDRMRQSQKDRQLCWMVGCYLQAEMPEIFEQCISSCMSKPNAALSHMLFAARGLTSRSLKHKEAVTARLKSRMIDNAEAEAALDKIRNGKNGKG